MAVPDDWILSSREEMAEERDRSIRRMDRMLLWTGIANGAGLAAAAGKMLDKLGGPTAYLLLPSCWFFAAGLLLVGCAAILEAERFVQGIKSFRQVDGKYWIMPARKGSGVLLWLNNACEVAACLAAAAGLLYPLIVLSVRTLSGQPLG